MSKVVRAKVEDELGTTENKAEYPTELKNFIDGTPPPLEGIDSNKEVKGNDGVVQGQMEQARQDTKSSTPATTASKPKQGNHSSVTRRC